MPATIEYIEEIIARYERARAANEQTPTRRGNVIVLTPEDADEVMVTADLHGHRKNFNAIRRIADLDNHARRHLILQEVCHGGPSYPSNGGCMSHAMLEDVAKLKVAFPERVHFLMSNHELAEATDYPILKANKMLNLMFRLGMQEMYGRATDQVRQAYVAFLKSCPLAVRLPNGILICHSLPENVDRQGFDKTILDRPLDSTDLREHGEVFNLVWGRDYRAENARAFAKAVNAKVLIHGHEPCPEGFQAPNDTQLIIDCCGDKACYVILPVGGKELTHTEVVTRVQRLA